MAYTAAVTLMVPTPERISRNLGLVMGTCDITLDHSTGAEITDITKYFKNTDNLTIIVDGCSDNGHMVRWNPTDKCFHGYYPTKTQAAVTTDKLTITASGSANITDGQSVTVDSTFRSAVDQGAGDDVGDDVDIGKVNFIAIGLI